MPKSKEISLERRVDPRVAIELGFRWDEQDAYLFDIDGTLLRSRDRIHVDSFASSVQRVTGFEVTLAGIVLQASTDTGILREACNQAGIPPEVVLRVHRDTLFGNLVRILDACKAAGAEEIAPVLAPEKP